MSWYTYIPQKTVKRYVIWQGGFLIFLVVGSLFLLRYFFRETMAEATDITSALEQVDAFLYKMAAAVLIAGFVGIAWVSYVYFYPLGRLLAKAKNIKRGTYRKQWDQEVEAGQDFGEWYELELTLNKINREIKKHKEDKKRREMEIETLAGAVSDGVIAIDPMKRVQFFNGQMALILGKVFDPLSAPSYLDEVFRAPKLTLAVDAVIQTGQSRRIQIPMRTQKTAENHIFDVYVTPVKEERKNKFHGVIAVFHDITDAKRVEELRIDFVANASHELKTPLTSIKGYVDSLLVDMEKNDYSAAREKLGVVARNVDRLNELVKDLLTLSRLSSSEDAMKEEIGTEEITEGVFEELRPLSDAKKQVVLRQFKAPVVKANRLMLGQLITNLVENAIKYCQVGAQIKVTWEVRDQFVLLRVADNGPGVSEQHQPRLFERFYRVQNGRVTSGVSGTGLGLSIAKNSMTKMGGRIEVDSFPGKGTVFTCYFPKH